MEELSGVAYKAISWWLGNLDLLVYLLQLVPNRPKFFADGWGDLNKPHEEQLKLEQQMLDGSPSIDVGDSMIEWELGDVQTLDQSMGLLQCRGSFLSPVASSLPDVVKRCNFLAVSPGGTLWEADKEPKVVVIMLSATGEQSTFTRKRQALYLARSRGWSSIIVTAPFYASRRPAQQTAHYLRSVEHVLLQSLAAMAEGALLATWATKRWPCRVCVTGFSWGGAMAGCACMLALRWSERPSSIACVPYVGCSSPAVLVDGILSSDICWEALRRGSIAGRYGTLTLPASDGGEDQEVTRARLLCCLDYMQSPNLEHFALFTKGVPRSLGAVHVVTSCDDLIITKKYADQLTASLTRCSENVMVQWCSGGHVVAFLRRQSVQVNAILTAVDRVLPQV
ncbi:hypothetical protein B484DRAFT_328748 [Ochromonadaceae sp. CCMP2298]|nr:hypothetical protein B484DRAFT_328748 [Ochromonadaceae sp. CCMP2298]|mmetsp:Transcript_8443/g.18542  ORF Transcript_8443/g.18542 Transcript_8443/m.18542 type:complete len:395 (-) Transcript_8443:44-1228(-)